MHPHRLRIPAVRRALGVAIAGALAAGALAGPAMAATDDGSADLQCRKAGEKPVEYLIAGGDGEPQRSIIAVL